MLGKQLFDQVMDRCGEVIGGLQDIRRFLKGLCHNGIQHHIGGGNGVGGAHHTEFKFIVGKCKGRGPVPVCGILIKIRKCGHAGP